MNVLEQLLAKRRRYHETVQRLSAETIQALDTVKASQDKLDQAVEEKIEEINERIEDSKSEAQRQAEQDWSGGGQKFGNLEEDEPEASKPVRRAMRDDDSTRSFGASHDEEEESEPYRRPQRWDDEDESESENTPEPVSARSAKHSWDEEEEEGESPSASRSDDWGGSTRRFGNYGDDEDRD
ncbi:MAG: hypothetical protein ACRC20_13435 [Segniliparus sp.]|uniref:hypothetical protein n=1 Tax=Segniliparus sp. TaxID=2804064 RepID=UPI003F2F5118